MKKFFPFIIVIVMLTGCQQEVVKISGISVTNRPYERIFAVDSTKNIAEEFMLSGNALFVLHRWGQLGSWAGAFNRPCGIGVNDYEWGGCDVFISDTYNHRIQAFAFTDSFQREWGSEGDRPGQFQYPVGIEVVELGPPYNSGYQLNDYIFVADRGNNRIQVFDNGGKFIRMWGERGDGKGQFKGPNDIAICAFTDKVYVADTYNRRIQVFDTQGNFLFDWGKHGKGDGQFGEPYSIVVSDAPQKHAVFVLDTFLNRVQKFEENGKFLAKWGEKGTGQGQFDRPIALSLDLNNNVYVAECNGRIQKFNPNGKFLSVTAMHKVFPYKPANNSSR